MWRSFSLRTRICLLLCVLFLLVALIAVFLLREFSNDQLVEENEPAAKSAALIAVALNDTLKSSSDPHRLLEAFATSFKAAGKTAITVRLATDDTQEVPAAGDAQSETMKRAPSWFVAFIDMPIITQRHPILIDGQRVGDLVFDPTLEPEIHEKWIGFLAIMTAGLGLAIVTVVVAFLTIGTALRPLRDLGLGLARLRAGNYAVAIDCRGPPEISLSCGAANDLGATLDAFHRENRSLLRKMVSMQDDERRDIARELHDELGPLLFSIRANATAFSDAMPDGSQDHPAQRVMQSVEALQSTNRRILDRLRPHYIEELGIAVSIESLVRKMRAQSPDIVFKPQIDPDIGTVDRVVAQTIYRVLQEGITNVMRHSDAKQAILRVAVRNDWVDIEVIDDGVGLRDDFVMGRGLTGMRERVRALGGTFDIVRIDDATIVRCGVPTTQSD